MTEYFDSAGVRIAYEVAGDGPLVVLAHGIGDRRQVFRHLVPKFVAGGYRVVSADLRGHGESSTGDWKAISRTDVAGDLAALIRHLGGGPAVIVGHSISGGAATIANAKQPDLVAGVVELCPFTKVQKPDIGGLLRISRYRRGISTLLFAHLLGSLRLWTRYLDIAYATKPADYDSYIDELRATLTEPGRMAEFQKTGKTTPADAEAQLPHITRPALVVFGALDPDFADPRAEADAIVAAMPDGLGTVTILDGAGHYPQAEVPEQVAALVLPFLNQVLR